MDNILGLRVHVHPVALFSIVDSYERRLEPEKRVIGSLLGVKVQAGLVEILNSYAVPHSESPDEVGLECMCIATDRGAWCVCTTTCQGQPH